MSRHSIPTPNLPNASHHPQLGRDLYLDDLCSRLLQMIEDCHRRFRDDRIVDDLIELLRNHVRIDSFVVTDCTYRERSSKTVALQTSNFPLNRARLTRGLQLFYTRTLYWRRAVVDRSLVPLKNAPMTHLMLPRIFPQLGGPPESKEEMECD